MRGTAPILLAALHAVVVPPATAQPDHWVVKLSPISESEKAVIRRVPSWDYTTKAYKQEAIRLMVEEANRIAPLLPLGETLPIKQADLVEWYVGPPAMGCLGWIATTNFSYTFDRKLCAIARYDLTRSFLEAKAKNSWPLAKLDKQQAFQLATQIMAAVSIDVARLNRDFSIEITTPETEGLIRRHFFPHFWVNWRNKSGKAVAYIEFVVPTKEILQLDVRNTDYILRDSISIPNLAALLDQTNAPKKP